MRRLNGRPLTAVQPLRRSKVTRSLQTKPPTRAVFFAFFKKNRCGGLSESLMPSIWGHARLIRSRRSVAK